jgi:hypothetical protein
MPDRRNSWIALWIYVSAWASASGWILSALGQLNRTGYILMLLPGLLLLWRNIPADSLQQIRFAKIRKRFSRPLPAIFAVLSMLAFVGGLLYVPNNYDYLTYRFPRILHWTAQNSWHWIHTANPRMNYQAPGFEWLMTPLFVFFKTDRLFFLINLISFCLLPGLIFSTFRLLRISPRTSWIWMWLLPAGYCYVLQAGSVGTDIFSTVYLLAALYFILLARETRHLRFLFLSWLSICLLTGAKLSNAPLFLPWLILCWPLLNQLVKRYRLATAATLFGILVSIVPVLVLNSHHSGDWTGDPINSPALRIRNPAIGLAGNFLQLASGNFVPPVFPWAAEWNRQLPEISFLKTDFPRLSLKAGEIQIEERAGLGFGLSVYLLAVLLRRGASWDFFRLQRFQKLFVMAGLLSMLTFMGKFGPPSASRLFAPYYVILVAVLMMYLKPEPRGQRFWRWAACVAALTAILPLMMSPSRPLWPASTVTSVLARKYPENKNIRRAFQVYSVYRYRSDSLIPLRSFIPDTVKTLGLIQSGDDPETSLWIPFGSRKVIEIFPGENPCDRGISTVVIHETALPSDIQKWLKRRSGKILGQKQLVTKASSGSEDWYVVQMDCPTKTTGRAL